MQAYVAVMILLVVGGTLLDIIHKVSQLRTSSPTGEIRKAKRGSRSARDKMVPLAMQSAVVDVMASGEFCNMKRRLAHLLGTYRLRLLCRRHDRHGVQVSDERDIDPVILADPSLGLAR